MYPKDNKRTDKSKVISLDDAKEYKLPTPQPLEVAEKEELEYPVDALGQTLGNAAKTIHKEIKAPLAMCGQSLLAAAALMSQPYYNIRFPHGSTSPLSLFAITTGGSGDRKSRVDKICLKPIKDLEQRLVEEHREEKAHYKLALEAHEQTKKSILQANKKESQAKIQGALIDGCSEPDRPLIPYMITEDPTVEGLFRSLNEGHPSQGIFTDEGAMIIGGHALNGENKLKTAGRFSKLWEASPFDRTRIGDEISKLYGRRVSMHIMVQPSILSKLLTQEDLELQGFLPRFLLAYTDSLAGSRPMSIEELNNNIDNIPAIQKYNKVMARLANPEKWPLKEDDKQHLEPKELIISRDALPLYVDTYNSYERQLGRLGNLDHLRPFVSRFMEQAGRIAGVLLCVDEGTEAKEISVEYLKRGIALAQYSLFTWDNTKAITEENKPLEQAQVLLDWLHADGCDFVYSRKVSQLAPNNLRKKSVRDSAIKILVEHGWLYPVEGGKLLDEKHRKNVWKVMKK